MERNKCYVMCQLVGMCCDLMAYFDRVLSPIYYFTLTDMRKTFGVLVSLSSAEIRRLLLLAFSKIILVHNLVLRITRRLPCVRITVKLTCFTDKLILVLKCYICTSFNIEHTVCK